MKKRLFVLSTTTPSNVARVLSRVGMVEHECAGCSNVTVAAAGFKPYCSHCGGNNLKQRETASVEMAKPELEALVNVECPSCLAHNIYVEAELQEVASTGKDGKVVASTHCVECAHPMSLHLAESDEEDEEDEGTESEEDESEEASTDGEDESEEEDESEDDTETADYENYFRGKLDDWGVESPTDIPDDQKDNFFNEVDQGWDSQKEESKPMNLFAKRRKAMAEQMSPDTMGDEEPGEEEEDAKSKCTSKARAFAAKMAGKACASDDSDEDDEEDATDWEEAFGFSPITPLDKTEESSDDMDEDDSFGFDDEDESEDDEEASMEVSLYDLVTSSTEDSEENATVDFCFNGSNTAILCNVDNITVAYLVPDEELAGVINAAGGDKVLDRICASFGIYGGDLDKVLSDFKFTRTGVTVTSKAIAGYLKEKRSAEAAQAVTAQVNTSTERLMQSIQLAAAGINRGNFSGSTNVLATALVKRLKAVGVKDAEAIIASTFSEHEAAYLQDMFTLAQTKIMPMSDEVRNEMAGMLSLMNAKTAIASDDSDEDDMDGEDEDYEDYEDDEDEEESSVIASPFIDVKTAEPSAQPKKRLL